MLQAEPPKPLTEETFLAWESAQEARHECVAGTIVSFAGGTIEHTTIVGNVFGALTRHLQDTDASVYFFDLMVATGASYRYPDLVVTNDPRDAIAKTRILRYPLVIVEVLSESTAAIDRGEKLDEYCSVPSLQAYVLIDSRKRWCATYERTDAGWIATLPQTSGSVTIAALACAIDFATIYKNVD